MNPIGEYLKGWMAAAETLERPYPEDVFTPMSTEEVELAVKAMNEAVPLRLGADARRVGATLGTRPPRGVVMVLCPRCQIDHYTPYEETWKKGEPPPPALSRLSRGHGALEVAPIWVCSRCGQDEALREFYGQPLQPPDDWPVELTHVLPPFPSGWASSSRCQRERRIRMDALCDSCGAPLGLLQGRCGVALANQRVVLSFDLCDRCQAGLLMALKQFLASHPPRQLAA